MGLSSATDLDDPQAPQEASVCVNPRLPYYSRIYQCLNAWLVL